MVTNLTTDEMDIQNEIAEIKKRLADLEARLPAHSIPPAMIAELDELEERLIEAKVRLVGQKNQEQE